MGMCYMMQQDYIDDHRGGAPTSATPPSCGSNSIAQAYIAPLVIAYPLWLRLLQSLKRYYLTAKRVPPLPNAIKYGLSLSVVLFALFNPEVRPSCACVSSVRLERLKCHYRAETSVRRPVSLYNLPGPPHIYTKTHTKSTRATFSTTRTSTSRRSRSYGSSPTRSPRF